MTLEEAIKRAKRIECSIHVGEGWSHQAKVSKKDALLACKDYLQVEPMYDDETWENEQGSIIAMAYWNEAVQIERLSIGR